MKKLFTLLTLALMSIGSAWADDITISWLPNSMTEATKAGTASVDDILTVSDFTMSSPVSMTGISSGWGCFTTTTTDAGKNKASQKDYLTFTITVKDGYKFIPTQITATAGGAGTGDNGALISETIIASATSATIKKASEGGTALAITPASATIGSGETYTFYIHIGSRANTNPVKGVNIKDVVLTGTYGSATAPVFASNISSLTLALNPAVTTKSATFKLTGNYLTDGTYNLTVPSVAGLSVTPTSFTVASGVVDQEFTVSYTSDVDVAAASANITATVNDIVATVAVNYSARLSFAELSAISEATTWDFTSWNETVELSDKTDLNYSTRYVYSDIADVYSLTAPSGFAANKLAFKGQFPVRAKKSQNGAWTFKTTVPGTITVDFSDTGSSGDNPHKRYLKVNDVVTGQYTQRNGSSDKKTSEAINVPAGEVTITAWDNDAVDAQSNPIPGGAQIAICLYKIVFTPLAAGNDVVEVGQYEWATRVASNDLDFTGSAVKAYIVTDHTNNALTLTQVNKVASGTPILLNAAKGSYTIPNSFTGDADATTGNKLQAGTGAAVSAESGKTKYVLSAKEGNAVFKKIDNNAATVPVGKAYLEFAEVISAPELDIVFNGDVTGISATLVNNEKVNSEVYDLQGRKVMNPAKGLYIVNGRKVIIK